MPTVLEEPFWKHMMKKRKTNCQTFSPHQLNSTQLYFIRQISVKLTHTHTHTHTHTLTHTPTHTHTHKNGNRVTEICYVDISFFFHPTLFHAQKNIEVLVLTHLLLLLSFQEIQKLDFKKYPEQKKVKKILGFSSACSCLITYICSTEAPFILIIGFHIQIFILTSIRPKSDMLENL